MKAPGNGQKSIPGDMDHWSGSAVSLLFDHLNGDDQQVPQHQALSRNH